MAVNVDSVVPLWVQTLNAEFYTALTDQEDALYIAAELIDTDAHTSAIAQFQLLVDAITDWKNASVPTRTASSLNAIPSFLYTANMYYERFNLAMAADNLLDAKSVFDMGGFMETVIGRAVEYYDDLTQDPIELTLYESAKIAADIDSLAQSVWLPLETSKLNAIETLAVGGVRSMNGTSLFDGFPAPSVGVVPKTKLQTAEWIFLTLNWKWVKDTFPAASGMNIPSILTTP